MSEKHTLSKSTFMRSCQCAKSLFLHKYHPHLRDEISKSQAAIFERGTQVGQLARQLFPGGIDSSPPTPFEYDKSVAKTAELIRSGATVIYEAAFQHEGVLSAIDILVCHQGEWKAYEVKSATSLKEQFILDASLQYYVIAQSGMPLKDISLIRLNNTYLRNGEIEPDKLFIIESVTAPVLENQGFIKQQIQNAKTVLAQESIPKMDIGQHCEDPYPCDFRGHCWRHIPEISVFDIVRLKAEKKFELYRSGVLHLKDVPDSFPLNKAQKLQVDCCRAGNTTIDRDGIRAFLQTLHYPLYFLDFETFGPAVPLYDHSKPYQQIPFQYSLHYKEGPDRSIEHREFLADAGPDPRIPFIERLLSDLDGKGDILTYNKAFETGRLKELAAMFPQYAAQVENILERVKDLMLPFQKSMYYSAAMNGSYSIKSVLPALVPELSYKHLEIADGGSASNAFEQLMYETDKNKIATVRNQLLEYCKLDTFAMVKILEVLEKKI